MATAELTPIGVGIHSVLVATDFSHSSKQALDLGLQLAKSYKAHAYIVLVVPGDEFMLAGPEAYVAAKDAARRDLDTLNTELTYSHPDLLGQYHLYLLEGDVAQSILNFSHQRHADLVIVGTHGRGGFGKALLGSVAERVFRGSSVPVLTVGPHCCRAAKVLAPQNILVAADFTPASERAAQWAVGLASQHKSRLTLLHVFGPKDMEHLPDRDRARETMKNNLKHSIVPGTAAPFTCRLEPGRVVPTVLRVAEEISADLVVIGVKPSIGVLNRFLWPNAYEIVRESQCPVLTVREKTNS